MVSRSDNGILVRIKNGEVAEIQGYVTAATAAYKDGSPFAEQNALYAIKRWVEHVLRMAENTPLPARPLDEPTTRWECEDCGRSGLLRVDPGAGVYEGVDAVYAAHDTAECQGRRLRVQAIDPSGIARPTDA